VRKHISTLLLVFCLTFVAASAYNQTLSYTLDNVFETSAAAASARLVGGGLTLGPVPTAIARTGSGDEILWQQARLVTDPRGGQHAFYDQVVRTARGDIPLVGSEIGVHTHNGRVIVAGGQYRTVTIANAVRLSRDDAPRAISRAMAARGWRTVDFDTLPLSDRARIFGELRLVLAPVNGAFRYAYPVCISRACGGRGRARVQHTA